MVLGKGRGILNKRGADGEEKSQVLEEKIVFGEKRGD